MAFDQQDHLWLHADTSGNVWNHGMSYSASANPDDYCPFLSDVLTAGDHPTPGVDALAPRDPVSIYDVSTNQGEEWCLPAFSGPVRLTFPLAPDGQIQRAIGRGVPIAQNGYSQAVFTPPTDLCFPEPQRQCSPIQEQSRRINEPVKVSNINSRKQDTPPTPMAKRRKSHGRRRPHAESDPQIDGPVDVLSYSSTPTAQIAGKASMADVKIEPLVMVDDVDDFENIPEIGSAPSSPEERREKHLANNRSAARRSRAKSLKSQRSLEKQSQELEAQNVVLADRHRALKDEAIFLRHQILDHAHCNDEFIKKFIMDSAVNVVAESKASAGDISPE